ncbi:MAG: molybdate ABC transporter substrate-binding protein [Proteobacteria bacterium]|nr:molybdate ABC transporter substrate-binding protein [Pseudomonadota bacterium]MBI3499295.1 molybdate ABC transporter substrate-binding protein [Pseudomonadota bacterium]
MILRSMPWAYLGVALTMVMVGAAALSARPATAEDLLVFAAASLKNALDDANVAYRQQGGAAVTVSYAASPALAKQIEAEAPADLFISADLDWMDYVQSKGLIKPETRVNLLGNRIVLVAPADSAASLTIARGFPLAARLGSGRLAMADTAAVPAGKYGRAALEFLGVWDAVKDRIAQAENVRAALLLVATGEAPFGIVYSTDAAAEPKVKVVGVFPENTHPPIIYPASVIARSTKAEAPKYLAWLRSPAAAPFFATQGFEVVK